MIRLFVGQDKREWVGLNVFCSSVWSRASEPVSITPIGELVKTDGTNAFTLSRYTIPEMCDYKGWAIFADGSDMLCLADIVELWDLRDMMKAVQVVKRDYQTKHPTKYLGQPNKDYPRKNWSSLMLINCAHFGWRRLKGLTSTELHRFSFLQDDEIGDLPKEWNYLIGEEKSDTPAKIAHFTIGLPMWGQYADWEYADEWRKEREAMVYFQEWK